MENTELRALKEQFTKECHVVDMVLEYGKDYVGEERYVIVTALSREEMLAKYAPIISDYEPFAVAPAQYASVQQDYNRNERKHGYRMKCCNDFYSYDDDLMEIFHPELQCRDEFFYEKEERLKKEKTRELQKAMLTEGLMTLTETQRRRVIARYYENKTSRVIAKEEGVNYSAVDHSLELAVKKLRKYFQKRVCILTSHYK